MSNTTAPAVSLPANWLDVYDTPYSNQYNTVANAFFLGLIASSLAGCFVISWRTQRSIPFSFVLCVALVMEIVAYALRFSAWNLGNFTLTVGLSTIAPIFLTIAIHLASAEVICCLGAAHAPLTPNTHLRLFVWTDILAALFQGVGLALTFSGARPVGGGAWRLKLPSQAAVGQSILFTGLFLQCLALAGALVCLTITYMKAGRADRTYGYTTFQHQHQHQHQHRSNGSGPRYGVPLPPRLKTFLVVLPLAGACVLARCIYRAAAAWGGLGSPIARDNVLWLVAEGVLLTEAMVTLAVFHPAMWLDDAAAPAASTRHHDMEAATGGGGPSSNHPNKRVSMFSMGSNTSRAAKRLSYATTIGSPDMLHLEEPAPAQMQMQMHEHAIGAGTGGLRHHHHHDEASQLMFQSHLIAPSDAGSASSNSRRGSSGSQGSSQPDPYLHRPGFYDDDAAGPYDARSGDWYNDDNNDTYHHSHRHQHSATTAAAAAAAAAAMISPDTRGLSPLEAEAEADRISIAPEVPRKSSKRASRLLSPSSSAAAGGIGEGSSTEGEEYDDFDHDDHRFEVPRKSSKRLSRTFQPNTAVAHHTSHEHEDEDEDEDEDYEDDFDRLEIESVNLPLRKPSRKETDDSMEEVTLKSTYSTSLYSQ